MNLSCFFLRFVIWSIFLQSIVWLVHETSLIASAIQTLIAWLVTCLYAIFFNDVLLNGNIIKHIESGKFLIIDQSCTGLNLIACLVAGFFSLSCSWTDKTLAAIIATLLIQFENILRITHLLYVINHPINSFEFYHLYFWQLINFITALLVFYLISQFFSKKEIDVFK